MSSTHKVIVNIPSKPCDIFIWSQNGYLPKLFFLSQDSKRTDIAMTSYEFHAESISNGIERDQFGNKSVFHNYIEGDISIALKAMGAIITPYNSGEFYYYSLKLPGGSLYRPYAFRLGRGPNRFNVPNQYWVFETVSADFCHYNIFETSSNQKLSKETTGWKSFSHVGAKAYAVQWTKSEPTAYGKSKGRVATYYENKVADGHDLTYIGSYSGNLSNYDTKAAFSYVPKALPLIDHILPESFTNDVFSKFAIPDVNNCENLRELKEIRKSLPPLLKVIRKHNVKSFAELYLWWKYTYSTTMLDLEAYYKFFVKWFEDSRNDKDYRRIDITYSDTIIIDGHDVDRVTRYHIYTKPYNIGVLEALGLEINLSNTWDLLPFSFVVDWFANIGDLFARIDHDDFMSHVRVLTVSVSTKCTQTYSSLPGDQGTSSITRSQFKRDVMKTLPTGCISLSTNNPFRHILDGGALYFANKH